MQEVEGSDWRSRPRPKRAEDFSQQHGPHPGIFICRSRSPARYLLKCQETSVQTIEPPAHRPACPPPSCERRPGAATKPQRSSRGGRSAMVQHQAQSFRPGSGRRTFPGCNSSPKIRIRTGAPRPRNEAKPAAKPGELAATWWSTACGESMPKARPSAAGSHRGPYGVEARSR
jgi:hypothetical protein